MVKPSISVYPTKVEKCFSIPCRQKGLHLAGILFPCGWKKVEHLHAASGAETRTASWISRFAWPVSPSITRREAGKERSHSAKSTWHDEPVSNDSLRLSRHRRRSGGTVGCGGCGGVRTQYRSGRISPLSRPQTAGFGFRKVQCDESTSA